jgi:CRP/FNR family cyclic AMP-dependent transcriptional regulator
LEHCQRRRYPAKSTIIFAGEKGESLYYIIRGTVTVVIENNEGREMVIACINDGEFFGELGIYSEDAQTRSACVRARTDCEVGELKYKRFHELAKIYPSSMQALDS